MNLRYFLLLGVLFYSANSWGQSLVEYNSYWDQYLTETLTGPENNIPGDAVYDAIQSSDGFIWLVCSSGIVRYDGITTKVYGPDNAEYEGSTLYEMHEDSKGNFWLPTIGEGLMKFNDGTFTHYRADYGIASDLVKSLAITKGDTIWVGTYGAGIQAFYEDSVIATYNTENGLINNQVWRLMLDDKNRLWVGTNGGLSVLEEGKITNFTTENGLPYNVIRGLTQMENGDVWVGTDKEGIVVFEDLKPVTYYNVDNGLNDSYPQYFAQDPSDGSVWIAHHGIGVDRFHEGEFKALTTEDGLISGLSTFVLFSKEGLAFIGSEKGVSILKKRKIDVVDINQGLSADFLINVNEDSTGTVWVGTEGKGFNYKKEEGWGVLENPPTFTNGYSSGAASDREGNMWFNTKGTGIAKIENREIVETYTEEEGLLSGFIRGIAFDYENKAWVGTNEGLNVIHEDGKIDTFNTDNGLPNDFIMTAMASSDSSIWVGTFGGGAAKFKGEEVAVYDTSNSLLTNKVYVIMEDSRGNMLLSGANGGLSLITETDITNYTVDDGLPSGGFNALVEDDLGNLWLGDGGSIYKIKMQDIYDFKNDEVNSIPSAAYTMEDGFPSQTLEIGYSSTAIKRNNGDILFATNDGLAVIDPERFMTPAPTINPYVDEVRVNDEIRDMNNPIILDPDDTMMEITYSAINFSAPTKTKFRVRLSDVNDEWIYMGDRKTVYYDFLPDGEYTFEVSATNADGQWNSSIAELNFIVLPPYYKSWWFILLCMVGFAGIITAVVRVRYKFKMNELNQELAVQQKLKKERERISRDLHDNVGAQITNLIIGLEISNIHLKRYESDKAMAVIETLDNDARGAMTELRETIWLLDQHKINGKEFESHIKGYINRQEYYLNNLKVDFENQLEDSIKLDPTQLLHLLRIIQEGLNNCRKHAEAGHFKIKISKTDSCIEAILKDDGKGMNIEEKKGEGSGLRNIQRRVEEIKGEVNMKSELGEGTEIVIKFPLIP